MPSTKRIAYKLLEAKTSNFDEAIKEMFLQEVIRQKRRENSPRVSI